MRFPRRAAAISASASSSEAAIGFSTSTSIPCSRSWQPMRACSTVGTARLTASTRPVSAATSAIASHPKFCGDFARAVEIRIDHADQRRAVERAPNARVIAAKIARAHNGHANWIRRAHQPRSVPAAGADRRREGLDGDRAASAASISASRSKSRVRPASIASAVAFDRRITSIVRKPTTGTSNRMSCARLADFHDDQRWPADDPRRALDGFVGAFHGFDGHAGAVAHHHRLAQIERGDLLRDRAAVGDVRGFASVGSAARQHSRRGHSGSETWSSPPAECLHPPALAPPRRSANRYFSRATKARSFASFQSGRIELKILLCFTCPAITACVTPS